MKLTLQFFSTLLMLTFWLTGIASAQTGSITGVVTDSDRQPLPGATIQIQGSTLGAVTDNDGSFLLEEVNAGDYILIVRFIGYRTTRAEVAVTSGRETVVNLTLADDPLGLDEVIVSGTFNPATRLESSTAITIISPEQIKQRVPRGTGDLLRTVPGVQVSSNYGESGADVTVRGLPFLANSSFRYVSLRKTDCPFLSHRVSYSHFRMPWPVRMKPSQE